MSDYVYIVMIGLVIASAVHDRFLRERHNLLKENVEKLKILIEELNAAISSPAQKSKDTNNMLN